MKVKKRVLDLEGQERTYRVYKTEIHSAHYIEGHKHCGQTHGHTYQMEFWIEAKEEFYDFANIKKKIETILKKYDHTNITKKYNIQTVEKLATVIIKEVKKVFPERRYRVKIFETSKFGVVAQCD